MYGIVSPILSLKNMGRNRHLSLIAIVAAILLAGCGKADRFQESDLYVGRSGPFVIGVYFSGYAVVFKDGQYVEYDKYTAVSSGSYPSIKFTCSFMELDCTFQGPSVFTAKVAATGLGLPETMTFHRSDTPLDKDGDGRLDEIYGSAF